jgi:hypothetical protein
MYIQTCQLSGMMELSFKQHYVIHYYQSLSQIIPNLPHALAVVYMLVWWARKGPNNER